MGTLVDREVLERRGRWEWDDFTVWGSTHVDEDRIDLRSRQDCEDLIALLERVRERLP